MKSSSRPSVSLSKVPSVKELCELLGFQHASLKDTNTFMEVTRAWRKSFTTSSGRRATDILHWNQSSDQQDLDEMAQKFIDGGNGDRFWLPSRSWNHDSDLQFPEDRDRIVALLKQLFWKQNRYAFNNSQYGHKGTEPRDGLREKTTPVRQVGCAIHSASPTPVALAQADLGALQAKSKSPRNPPARDKTSHKPAPTVNSSTRRIDTHVVNIFDVPSGSDPHDDTNATRAPKRLRPHYSAGETPPKKKNHVTASPRRTDRRRMVRNIPHKAPDDEVERLINLTNDETEVHDPARNVQTVQPTVAPIAVESSIECMPLFIAKRSAPTAPMVASDKRKNLSLQSNASKISGAISPSELNKSSTPSSSPTRSSSTVRKSKSWQPAPHLRTENLMEVEKSDSRISGSSPSPMPPPETANYTPLVSPVTNIANTLHESSEAEYTSPLKRPVETSNAPLHAENIKSVMHSSSTQEEDITKPLPNIEGYPSGPELSPPLSSYHLGNSANPAALLEQSQPPSKIPATPKYGNDASANLTENPSMLEIPVRNTETEANKPKVSTTWPNPAPTPQKTELPRHAPAQASSPKPRQKTQIPLWIITREPRYTEERWDDGKFMGTPLPTFIEGISRLTQRSHIEKIKLTLRAPTFDTKITVFKDAEDSWASAKETFIEKLKEAKAEARARRQLEQVSFKILVEPFYEEGFLPSGSMDEDEEEFDF